MILPTARNANTQHTADLCFIEDYLLWVVLEGDNQETVSNNGIESGGFPSLSFNEFGFVEDWKYFYTPP